MQNGPRYLTDTDINTVIQYTSLAPGAGVGGWVAGDTISLNQLGQIGQTGDGRFYRYALIGGTSTVKAGTLLVAPAQTANSSALAIAALTSQPTNTAFGSTSAGVSALSKGSKTFTITNGATTVTTDQFAGGYVEVLQTSGTNEAAVSYQLTGNSAAGNGGLITLKLTEPLDNPEALVPGTDTVNLRVNPYANVVASATAARPVGVVTVQVPNTATVQYLAWVQTQGECNVLGQGTLAAAFGPVIQSTTTAGAVAIASAATQMVVGQLLVASTDGNPTTVALSLI